MNTADIIFTTESDAVSVPSFKRRVVSEWIRQVAEKYDRQVGEITYVFCDDAFIKRLNKKELNHNYATDILTFDSCVGDLLFADIVISLDTVRDNAKTYEQTLQRECLRVMIHGVLHLCGQDDHSDDEKEQMRRAEDECLAMLPEDMSSVWRANQKAF